MKLKELVTHIKHRIQGKIPSGKARSGEWPRIRKEHLEKFPNCANCSGDKNVEVHHIKPFHIHPQLELEPSNLITLCESKGNGVNCHLYVGHLGNFKSVNVESPKDSAEWLRKLKARP